MTIDRTGHYRLVSHTDCTATDRSGTQMKPSINNAMSSRTLSWMLVAALMLLTLVPYHVHLHHDAKSTDDPAAVHGHVTDLHILVVPNGSDHHEASHTLEPTPDMTFKQTDMQLPVFAAVLVLSLLLPSIGSVIRPPAVTARRLPRFNRHTTPPLRAPPRA